MTPRGSLGVVPRSSSVAVTTLLGAGRLATRWRLEAKASDGAFPLAEVGLRVPVVIALPPLGAVIAAERAGFETRDIESPREHYAPMLRSRVERLTSRASPPPARSPSSRRCWGGRMRRGTRVRR